MIYKVSHYWVEGDYGLSIEDIEDAIEAAKKENCTVRLHWKGPYGDTRSIDITAGSDVDEVCNSLPKTYDNTGESPPL